MNIEIKEEGCGRQMELAKGVGTHMEESDYRKLAEMCDTKHMSEAEARLFIGANLGFDPLRVKIVHVVNDYYRDGSSLRARNAYFRDSQYNASDWNYFRFDVCGWQYEYVNGDLVFYES